MKQYSAGWREASAGLFATTLTLGVLARLCQDLQDKGIVTTSVNTAL